MHPNCTLPAAEKEKMMNHEPKDPGLFLTFLGYEYQGSLLALSYWKTPVNNTWTENKSDEGLLFSQWGYHHLTLNYVSVHCFIIVSLCLNGGSSEWGAGCLFCSCCIPSAEHH